MPPAISSLSCRCKRRRSLRSFRVNLIRTAPRCCRRSRPSCGQRLLQHRCGHGRPQTGHGRLLPFSVTSKCGSEPLLLGNFRTLSGSSAAFCGRLGLFSFPLANAMYCCALRWGIWGQMSSNHCNQSPCSTFALASIRASLALLAWASIWPRERRRLVTTVGCLGQLLGCHSWPPFEWQASDSAPEHAPARRFRSRALPLVDGSASASWAQSTLIEDLAPIRLGPRLNSTGLRILSQGFRRAFTQMQYRVLTSAYASEEGLQRRLLYRSMPIRAKRR